MDLANIGINHRSAKDKWSLNIDVERQALAITVPVAGAVKLRGSVEKTQRFASPYSSAGKTDTTQ